MNIRSVTIAATLSAVLAVFTPVVTHAQEPAVYAVDGVALGGYDVVTFFTEDAPELGTSKYAIMWHGAVWQFASAEALIEFEMNPEAYAPQFGGYCAYGVANGALSPVEIDQFSIRDGKLYLMRDAQVMARWQADEAGFIAAADANWPSVLNR